MVKHMADGSKQILLLDTAKVLADRTINSSSAINASMLGDEMWLVAGVQDTKGKWTTHVLSLDLYAAGNDTISGNDGNDVLFGQRGNDIIAGGAGNDYIEGNEGNDTLYGDRELGSNGVTVTNTAADGNDIIIGDNSFNFAAPAMRCRCAARLRAES
jgi:Ca2+-binding RTX toxin-like protein